MLIVYGGRIQIQKPHEDGLGQNDMYGESTCCWSREEECSQGSHMLMV